MCILCEIFGLKHVERVEPQEGMSGNGIYYITADGYESEEFGWNDYVFQNENGHLEVWTKENLENEGYTVQDDHPF